MKNYGLISILAASLSLSACHDAEQDGGKVNVNVHQFSRSDLTAKGRIEENPTAGPLIIDISHYFQPDSFCKYLDAEKFIPTNAVKIVKKIRGRDNEKYTIAKFSARLFDLHVIGGGTTSYEGGFVNFLVFDSAPTEVISKLGNIFGHDSEGIPKAVGINVKRTNRFENQGYTKIIGPNEVGVSLIQGRSGIECTVVD